MIERIIRLPYNYKKKAGKLLLKKEERYEKENGKQNADDWTCFSYDGRNVCRLWKLCTCGCSGTVKTPSRWHSGWRITAVRASA